ncbi:MAG: o-succinylbenzoate synthase [Prevotella sp.]|nr:o-succinylbenzoate synthase [Prevotella sp.]
MKVNITNRLFHFRFAAGTSRGVYTTRRSWFVSLTDDQGRSGVGESAPLPDLSCDALPDYEDILRRMGQQIEQTGEIPYSQLLPYPSMLFGLETALWQLERGNQPLDNTPFARGEEGIPINGLIWMGQFDEMSRRLEEKLAQGFHCIKLKIGAIDFDDELTLIRRIRQRYGRETVELRVDANGAFSPEEALNRMDELAKYDIHSIEQPIRQGQWETMAHLCRETPLPIALDEELIGVNMPMDKEALLDTIQPQYIILKPSLHGGMSGAEEWIGMARQRGIGSWVTSALESNIGLNAIAHFTALMYDPHITMPQGLGTGQIYSDNIPMPLEIRGEQLWVKT